MQQSKHERSNHSEQEIENNLKNKEETSHQRKHFEDKTAQDYRQAAGNIDYPSHKAMVESIKQEILQEMNAYDGSVNRRSYDRESIQSQVSKRSSKGLTRRLDPAEAERIKREILIDLQEQFAENNFIPDNMYSANHYEQAVKESIKRELLAEMDAQQINRYAQVYGYDDLISQGNLNRMIQERYRTLQNLHGDLRRELQSLGSIEKRTASSNPHVRELAQTILAEAHEQGLNLNDVINRVNGRVPMKAALRQRVSGKLNSGQSRNFIYGAGAALLAAMIFPSVKKNLHAVAVRTIEEGMDLADRARCIVVRAKEGVEDIIAEANFNKLQDEVDDEIKSKPEVDVYEN